MGMRGNLSGMNNFSWDTTFRSLFDRCVSEYCSGNEDFTTYYSEDDLVFLKSVGYKPREFFDFVEDFADEGSPSGETAMLVAAVRRDYLLTIQKGEVSTHEISPNDLPAKDAELDGVRWLPRILVKARAKLRGELDPNMMFSCGGDRAFLSQHDIHPADFLRVVWAAGDDDQKVLEYVKR
jgi:hypothetical protein